MRKRVALGLGGLCLVYLLTLLVLSYALQDRVEGRVRERLSYILRADSVEIDEVDVSLLRGRVVLRGVHAKRSSIGMASLAIEEVDIRLPPMGLALFDRDPSRVDINRADLQLSALGVATLRRSKSTPPRLGELRITDSKLRLVATSLFPGIGQAELAIEEALASDVAFNNSIAWLFKTERLHARLRTTGDVELSVDYEGGLLSVGGSLLGSEPITIPFAWPLPSPSELELDQLLALGKQLLRQLGPELAKRQAKALWHEWTE